MNITQTNNKNQTATIKLDIAKEDYEAKVQNALAKQAKNAQIKGFRPGKVPKNLVKKMYGTSILVDEINKLVGENLNNYLQENKVEILGQPLPQPSDIQFDVNNLEDYSFEYKVGLKPEVDLSYLKDKPTYTNYDIEISEEMIDKEVEHVRKQQGEVENPDGNPSGKDALDVTFRELDEDGNVKEGGYEHSSAFAFDQLKLKKDQTAITKLAVGETYAPFNIYRAFDKNKEDIAKQMLELTADTLDNVGTAFELTLNKINRVGEAELNQEFFDKLYGEGKVTTEAEMRDKIKENLSEYLGQASTNQLKNDVYKDLLEKVEVEMPDEFLKEWLLASKQSENNTEVTQEEVEKEYENFSKSLKSSLIFNSIAEQADLKVEFPELKEKVKGNLIEQFKYYGMPLTDNEEMLEGMIEKFMQDEKQVRQTHDQLMDDKIFDHLKGNVKVEDKSLTLEEFNELNQPQEK